MWREREVFFERVVADILYLCNFVFRQFASFWSKVARHSNVSSNKGSRCVVCLHDVRETLSPCSQELFRVLGQAWKDVEQSNTGSKEKQQIMENGAIGSHEIQVSWALTALRSPP